MTTPLISVNRRALLAGGAALVLAGCAGGSAPTQIYVLKPDLPQVPPGNKVSWQLAVATPNAAASLNIDRVALTRAGGSEDYFADAQWNDRLPLILQSALIDAFTASGRITAVSRDTAGLKADYTLETEVRDFTAHYDSDGPPSAVVHLGLSLIALPDRTIVSTFDSNHTAPASANNVPAIVAAFNVALKQALQETVNWALTAPPAVVAPATPSKPAPAHHRRRRRVHHHTPDTEATPEQ